jgi:signal peptidase I
MIIIVAITLISLVFAILAIIKIFFGLSKYFKLENVTYKKSVLILLYAGILSLVVSVFLKIINLGIFSDILIVIFEFLLFHYFLKKYYRNNWKKSLKIYVLFIISSVVLSLMLVISIRQFVVEPFFMQGESMKPTLSHDDYLIIDKLSKSYQRGDIIIFYNNLQKGFLTKRIIGLPDEKVEIKNKKVFINEIELKENYIFQEVFPNKIIILGSDEYFVLGDNLSKSADSRIFGAIKKDEIIGEVAYNLGEIFNNLDENN